MTKHMVVIRSIGLRDVKKIMRIEEECFDIPWPQSTFLMLALRGGRMEDKDGYVVMVVCEYEENITGYAVWEYEKKSREGHLLNIAITKKYQRQGFGKLLAKYVLADLKESSAKRCILEVRESNLPARRFYEMLGMHPIGRSTMYYETEDAIIYEILF